MRREPIASLADVVFVRQSGTRSINVEQDLRQRSISESYILTVQARRSLDRLFGRAQGERPQRAWTLTGPYGSGKSYFGLFMMNLLCSESLAHSDAREKLATVDPTLVLNGSELAKLEHTKGLLTIPIVGHRISVQECLRQGILRAASSLSYSAEVIQLAEMLAAWDATEPSHYLIEVIHRFVDLVTAPEIGYGGILLVLDEMGKPLEYAAAHPNKSDIYLLQEIAEAANRSGDKPILFVGMLHQSFERYAGYADSLTQKEWAKIQGRYEDIAFQEPPTQQMRLLANAIDYTDKSRLPEAWSTTVIEEAIAEGLTPALLQESEFRRICRQAAPFHPTALTALPYLFQRLAQNERSIFAYLTSSEPLGFQAHLQDRNSIRQVRLSDLFNYITTNFQGRIYAALRSRALTEALEKLNNTPNLSPLAADLLKTIGLLNWLAEIGPFDASKQKILFTLRSEEYTDTEITATLDKLEKRSIVVFRRFNQSYAIWQGSDVDVEERIEEARQQLLSTFSTAQAVQHYLPPQPAIARRHSYRTGTTRFFDVRYVDMVSELAAS